MWHALLRDTRFFELLHTLDQDLADQTRSQGCPCGGRLDQAHYPRKPRGGPANLSADRERRFSFCCARDGCRGRATPPSLRFLGRRVYFGVVVVLVTAMAQGVTPRRSAELRVQLGVDRRTLSRWRRWWQQHFPASPFWREHRARFSPAVLAEGLPRTLLDRFSREGRPEGVVALLRFLAAL
ncbi:MAG: hypothetical protein ABFS46_15730 [Myxococcota bacterium]